MLEMPVSWIGANGGKNDFDNETEANVMMPLPHEFVIGGVYMPPLLVASMLGMLAAMITAGMSAVANFFCDNLGSRSSVVSHQETIQLLQLRADWWQSEKRLRMASTCS
jgi:hypothetical protein